MLAPHEQLAAILGGRRSTYPSEDLLLRARLDLDQGRTREAALQAQAAQAALEAELRGEQADALRKHSEALGDLATAAQARDLEEREAALLGEVVVELERLARRRRHA
jgi:hypothetical protein